jgi:hypothetical protein
VSRSGSRSGVIVGVSVVGLIFLTENGYFCFSKSNSVLVADSVFSKTA